MEWIHSSLHSDFCFAVMYLCEALSCGVVDVCCVTRFGAMLYNTPRNTGFGRNSPFSQDLKRRLKPDGRRMGEGEWAVGWQTV